MTFLIFILLFIIAIKVAPEILYSLFVLLVWLATGVLCLGALLFGAFILIGVH